VRWRNPLGRLRDTRAAASAAYLGGFLLFATGGSGAVAVVALGRRLVDALSPHVAEFLAPLFFIVAVLAALGGLTVIAAGYMLPRQRLVGKVLLWLGSGVGLLTFAVHVVALTFAGRDAATDVLDSAVTVQGIAVLIVLYAQLRA
jgi:hypothetical protein